MIFFKVYPEVPAAIGKDTFFDKTIVPWEVLDLHLVFQGWLGCNLMTSHSCFFVTNFLKERIEKNKITGILKFKPITITKSELFFDVHGDLELPTCYWLEIIGIAGKDDIGLINNDLILSERFMALIEDDLQIGIMEVKEYI